MPKEGTGSNGQPGENVNKRVKERDLYIHGLYDTTSSCGVFIKSQAKGAEHTSTLDIVGNLGGLDQISAKIRLD